MWLIAYRPQSCWTLDTCSAPSTPGGPAALSLPPSAASSSSSSSSFSPSQPSLHLSSFSASQGHSPGPRWSACSVNICLMNSWLMFIYSVYMKWMVWLLLLFGEGSRPHLDLIICRLWPKSPLMSNVFLPAWDSTFSYLPHDMFHLCHFQSRLIFFFPLKENLEDPLSEGLDHFFVCLFSGRTPSTHSEMTCQRALCS